jgi:hypothetical protein
MNRLEGLHPAARAVRKEQLVSVATPAGCATPTADASASRHAYAEARLHVHVLQLRMM